MLVHAPKGYFCTIVYGVALLEELLQRDAYIFLWPFTI